METQTALQNFIMFLGPFKWPLFILTVVILIYSAIKTHHYFILNRPIRKGLNAILFWGMVTLAAGLTGQISGIWVALNSIIAAPDISPQFVLIGFLSSFGTTLYGLTAGLFSALVWWGMRVRLAQLEKQHQV